MWLNNMRALCYFIYPVNQNCQHISVNCWALIHSFISVPWSTTSTLLHKGLLANSHWLYHFLSDSPSVSRLISTLSPLYSWERTHTHIGNTHTSFGDSHTWASHCWSEDKVINSRRWQLLSFSLSLTNTHTHKLPTFGCLAYFPVLVSLILLMSSVSTS